MAGASVLIIVFPIAVVAAIAACRGSEGLHELDTFFTSNIHFLTTGNIVHVIFCSVVGTTGVDDDDDDGGGGLMAQTLSWSAALKQVLEQTES